MSKKTVKRRKKNNKTKNKKQGGSNSKDQYSNFEKKFYNIETFDNIKNLESIERNNDSFRKIIIDLYDKNNQDFQKIIDFIYKLSFKQLIKIEFLLGFKNYSFQNKTDLVHFFVEYAKKIINENFSVINFSEFHMNTMNNDAKYEHYLKNNYEKEKQQKIQRSIEFFKNMPYNITKTFRNIKETAKMKWNKTKSNRSSDGYDF